MQPHNIESLVERNATFARTMFNGNQGLRPKLSALIITCLDPRLDPVYVLGTQPGDVAVIRNVGGRVTPDVLRQLALLDAMTPSAGAQPAADPFAIVVMQHDDCGITRMGSRPEELGAYLGLSAPEIDMGSISNPPNTLSHDVSALRKWSSQFGTRYLVTGVLFDVETGLIRKASPEEDA